MCLIVSPLNWHWLRGRRTGRARRAPQRERGTRAPALARGQGRPPRTGSHASRPDWLRPVRRAHARARGRQRRRHARARAKGHGPFSRARNGCADAPRLSASRHSQSTPHLPSTVASASATPSSSRWCVGARHHHPASLSTPAARRRAAARRGARCRSPPRADEEVPTRKKERKKNGRPRWRAGTVVGGVRGPPARLPACVRRAMRGAAGVGNGSVRAPARSASATPSPARAKGRALTLPCLLARTPYSRRSRTHGRVAPPRPHTRTHTHARSRAHALSCTALHPFPSGAPSPTRRS